MTIWQKRTLRIESLSGSAATAKLGEWARLRIEIFSEYPYLYEGATKGEQAYLSTYLRTPRARILGLFEGAHVGGMATMAPLDACEDFAEDVVKATGLAPKTCLYVGDIIFEPRYRGRGLFNVCFNAAEDWGRAHGFSHIVAAAIRTSPTDAGRPQDYRPIAGLFARVGLEKLSGVSMTATYPSTLSHRPEPHVLEYWHKVIEKKAPSARARR